MSASGQIQRLFAGGFVTVEPGGQSLVVELRGTPYTKLIRMPLNGGSQQEIPLSGPMHLGYVIDNDSIRNELLLAPASGPTWYWPPAIFDLTSGKSRRIPLDYLSDFHHLAWTSDGKVIASAQYWRSSMWKFTQQPH